MRFCSAISGSFASPGRVAILAGFLLNPLKGFALKGAHRNRVTASCRDTTQTQPKWPQPMGWTDCKKSLICLLICGHIGKSTLLEAIAVALGFNPEGGTRNFGFSTRQSHSKLWEHIRLAKGIRRPMDGFFLRAESFFNNHKSIMRILMDGE